MGNVNSGRYGLYQEQASIEKISPFIIQPGMKFKRVRKRDCSNSEISKLLANGCLEEKHDLIIKMLGKYGLLNSYLIRTNLYHISKGLYDYSALSMRKILKALVNYGLLVQYEFVHEENGIIHGSPFIYSISGGGIKYLKKQGINRIHPFVSKVFTIKDAFMLMPMNQFHIKFLEQYEKSPGMKMDDYFGKCYQKTGAGNLYNICLSDNRTINIYLISVRKMEGWHTEYLKKLRKICIYSQEINLDQYAVFVICETEYMAMECARYKNCEAFIKDIDVYYIKDTSLLEDEGVLNRIIDVKPQNDYSERSTFSLKLKGEEGEKS